MWTHALPTTKCTGLYRARVRPCRGPWRTTSGLSTARLPHCQHELATAVRAHRSGHARRARKSGLPTRSARAVHAHARPCMRPACVHMHRRSSMSAKWTRGTQHQRRPATVGRKRASQAVQESYQARGGMDGLACNQGTTGLARAPHVLTGREGYGFGVRQTHPHPVALTPINQERHRGRQRH